MPKSVFTLITSDSNLIYYFFKLICKSKLNYYSPDDFYYLIWFGFLEWWIKVNKTVLILRSSSPKISKKSSIKISQTMTRKPFTIRSKSMRNSIPNKGILKPIQTTNRKKPTRPPRTTQRLGSPPSQTTFQQSRKYLAT